MTPDVANLDSVVAVGIVRLKVLLDINAVSPDITWSLWPSQLWTAIELNVAVVSGKSRASWGFLRPTNQAASLAVSIVFDHLKRDHMPKLTPCSKAVYLLCDPSSIWSEPKLVNLLRHTLLRTLRRQTVLSTNPSPGGREIAARLSPTPSRLLETINGLSLVCMTLGMSHSAISIITNYTILATMHRVFRCRKTLKLSGKRLDD
jgi:hypothetical protein